MLPWPSASRHPQDSQTDTVIGRRRDIPRETHLHAWVTPAAACFLTLQEIRLAASSGRTEPVSMATLSCLILAGKGRKRPAEIAARRSLLHPGVLGENPSDFHLLRQGSLSTKNGISPVVQKGKYPSWWHLLGGKGDSTRQLQLVSDMMHSFEIISLLLSSWFFVFLL